VKLRGQLVDEAGRPLAGSLECLAAERFDAVEDLDQRYVVRTDSVGRFELAFAPAGALALVVRAKVAAANPLRVLASPGVELQVVARRGTRLVLRSRHSAHGESWAVAELDGTPVWSRARSPLQAEVHPAPGRYTLGTRADGAWLQTETIEVSGEPLVLVR
jgi:hypothetical protein